MEASAKLLGSFLGRLRASWKLLGSFWKASGKLLGSFWEAFGQLLRSNSSRTSKHTKLPGSFQKLSAHFDTMPPLRFKYTFDILVSGLGFRVLQCHCAPHLRWVGGGARRSWYQGAHANPPNSHLFTGLGFSPPQTPLSRGACLMILFYAAFAHTSW